tara:strand:+ start:287 stop:1837 length:1551 start_codon:yes stop_codon:yes gene_type:complete
MENIGVKKIIIVGGGMSGWLAAICLQDYDQYDITVIESPDISNIGVGESTQPGVSLFLQESNFDITKWMPYTNSTFKYGVMFEGWSNNKFMVDSESKYFTTLDTGIDDTRSIADICIANNMSIDDFFNWFPPYRMSVNNKSPFYSKEKLHFLEGGDRFPPKPVQWNNKLMIDLLRKECINRNVTFINDTVVDVELDEQGYVSSIITINNKISGDLYLDCTGFSSVLLEKKYNISWLKVDDILYNDSAVAIRKSYVNPQKECHPYTKSTAMNSGWMWSIPTYNDIAHGYVYSSKYIDKDAAEKELRTKINEWQSPAFHVPFKTGAREVVAYKNVCGIGNSIGFVEPLEATNLSLTIETIRDILVLLNTTNNNWNTYVEKNLNTIFASRFKELLFFIFMHYHSSTKNDTTYWQDIHKIPVPIFGHELYNKLKNYPVTNRDIQTNLVKLEKNIPTIFSGGHWFQLLKGTGWYENINREFSEEVKKYGNHVLSVHKFRIDSIIDLYPNHYDYLTEWYESC